MLARIKIARRRFSTRGDRTEIIWPTAEHMKRKAEILGGKINAKNKPVGFDIHASTLPIDIYLKRGIIEPKHHKAAMKYGWLRWQLFGVTAAKISHHWREALPGQIDTEEPVSEELTDDERRDLDIRRAIRLAEASEVLQRSGTWLIVRRVILDSHFVKPGREERQLRWGLELLADLWRISNDE